MRVCRRCLTSEMDEAEYFKNLHDYIENLDSDSKASPEKYKERLSVCKGCDLLVNGMCGACGCFVELRAALIKNSCPYDKWQAYND